jgi:hypothetical protein
VDIQNIFLSGDFIKYPDGLGKRSLRIAASHSSRQANALTLVSTVCITNIFTL